MRPMRPLRIRSAVIGAAVASLCAVGCSDQGESNPSISALAPDEVLVADEPQTWDLSVHCGAGFFSYQINGKWWKAPEAGGHSSWMPVEWGSSNRGPRVDVVLEINPAGDELRATHAGRTVTYTPTELTEADLCD